MWAVTNTYSKKSDDNLVIRHYTDSEESMVAAFLLAGKPKKTVTYSIPKVIEKISPELFKDFSEGDTLIVEEHVGNNNKIVYYMTTQQIGEVMGISYQRVQQIEKRAMEKIRKYANNNLLDLLDMEDEYRRNY